MSNLNDFVKVEEMTNILKALREEKKISPRMKTILEFIKNSRAYFSGTYNNLPVILFFYDEVLEEFKKIHGDKCIIVNGKIVENKNKVN